MEALEQRLRTTRALFGLSMALYVVFLVAAVALGVSGRTFEDPALLYWVVPAVCAFLALPRSPLPQRWPTPQTEDDELRMEMIREELRSYTTRATVIRLIYLGVGLPILFVLPRTAG